MFASVTDYRNKKLLFENPPQRIISLVPSITELLFDLGLGEKIIAGTRYCIYPVQKHASFEIIGGTKKIDFEKINRLNPDLILANFEENTKEIVEELDCSFNVWVTYLTKLEENLKLFEEIGKIADAEEKARQLITDFKIEQSLIQNHQSKPFSYIYLIWKNPLMAISANTYISDFMNQFELKNIMGESADRYPALTDDILIQLEPEFLFLSSEPYPFNEKDERYFNELFAKKKTRVFQIDGSLTSWYGSRSIVGLRYFRQNIFPLLNQRI